MIDLLRRSYPATVIFTAVGWFLVLCFALGVISPWHWIKF